MKFGRKLRLATTIGAAAASLSLGLIAPTVGGASTALKGTITVSEGAGSSPNYIFPYVSGEFFSVTNMNDFQQPMYRPLYWFGSPGSAAVVPSLSLANLPVASNGNKTYTITMKGWKFADGQTVNAQSVMFFLNMYKADPAGYGGYVPGAGIPDQISSAHGSGNTVVINFTVPVGLNWILYNYLSEITPMPDAWDTTGGGAKDTCAQGTYGASSTINNCKNVEQYLIKQSGDTSTYTDAMWKAGTDGPWMLKAFDALGNVTFVPNPTYGGPQKAQVAEVKEVAFTSTTAEENALQAGTIDIGYVDPTVLTSPSPAPGVPGPNWAPIAGKYNLLSGLPYQINYDEYNFSGTPTSPEIDQLYVRQALQDATDQNGILSKIDKNYGVPDYSPLPPGLNSSIATYPKNPYPFSISAALALFKSHGWTEENGIQTCTSPGTGASNCGAGIASGAQMKLTMDELSGFASEDELVAVQVADWAEAGVQVSVTQQPFGTVLQTCPTAYGGQFSMCDWGGGWLFAPDYYPSGEELFETGASSNSGLYSDAKMDSLIKATDYTNVNLTAYAAYGAQQLPVLWKPQGAGTSEVIKTLKSSNGWTANPLAGFEPEYLHF